MPLGTEVDLGPGHIVLNRDPAHPTESTAATPTFRPMSIVAKRSPISATAELFLCGHAVEIHRNGGCLCDPTFHGRDGPTLFDGLQGCPLIWLTRCRHWAMVPRPFMRSSQKLSTETLANSYSKDLNRTRFAEKFALFAGAFYGPTLLCI